MNRLLRTAGLVGVAAGAVAAGAVAGAVAERRVVGRRRVRGVGTGFGRLRSEPLRLVADDGVVLHAEVDPPGASWADRPTIVFVHGYALNLDCWHFQRAWFRRTHRLVFYDQRSHGRSERSTRDRSTIDQLGADLTAVLEQLVPDGPVVLVGHSMGGMAIMAFAEQHPETFGGRVVGMALVGTSAGGLVPASAVVPGRLGRAANRIAPRVVAGLSRAPGLVEGGRRAGSDLGYLVTRRFAFGGDVPAAYVEFVDEMLAQTSIEVLAEFYPNFDAHDRHRVLAAFAKVPTAVIGGTRDAITPIEHSRTIAGIVQDSFLVECEGAGHMMMLERHEAVNAALDQLLAHVATRGAEDAS